MKFRLLILLLTLAQVASSQIQEAKKKTIDANRYGEIRGNPYYWKSPVDAILTMSSDEEITNVSININLYERRVEIYDGKQYTELQYRDFKSIEVPEKNIYAIPFSQLLIFNVYDGDKYDLTNTPLMEVEVREHNPPSGPMIKKTFVRKDDYKLFNSEETLAISTGKKSIGKVLGSDAVKLAKKKKNKLKSEADLVALLKLLEE